MMENNEFTEQQIKFLTGNQVKRFLKYSRHTVITNGDEYEAFEGVIHGHVFDAKFYPLGKLESSKVNKAAKGIFSNNQFFKYGDLFTGLVISKMKNADQYAIDATTEADQILMFPEENHDVETMRFRYKVSSKSAHKKGVVGKTYSPQIELGQADIKNRYRCTCTAHSILRNVFPERIVMCGHLYAILAHHAPDIVARMKQNDIELIDASRGLTLRDIESFSESLR